MRTLATRSERLAGGRCHADQIARYNSGAAYCCARRADVHDHRRRYADARVARPVAPASGAAARQWRGRTAGCPPPGPVRCRRSLDHGFRVLPALTDARTGKTLRVRDRTRRQARRSSPPASAARWTSSRRALPDVTTTAATCGRATFSRGLSYDLPVTSKIDTFSDPSIYCFNASPVFYWVKNPPRRHISHAAECIRSEQLRLHVDRHRSRHTQRAGAVGGQWAYPTLRSSSFILRADHMRRRLHHWPERFRADRRHAVLVLDAVAAARFPGHPRARMRALQRNHHRQADRRRDRRSVGREHRSCAVGTVRSVVHAVLREPDRRQRGPRRDELAAHVRSLVGRVGLRQRQGDILRQSRHAVSTSLASRREPRRTTMRAARHWRSRATD